jgi:hypothetical protein
VPSQTTMIRWSASLLVALTVLATLAPARPAEAVIDGAAETSMACAVNQERASRGLPPLRVASDLTRVARDHSVRMANADRLYHNPDLATQVTGWRRLAENVGVGPSVTSVHNALMGSDGHRANILNSSVEELGIGIDVRGSRVWVTQVFRQPSGARSGSLPSCGTTSVASASASYPVPVGGTPLSGDWNGDGISTPGWFKDGRFTLVSRHGRSPDISFIFGRGTDIPVTGDWNGDGRTTIGVVRDGTWLLRNANSRGPASHSFLYGRPTDTPVTGDWNRDGRTTIGVVRDGTWLLRNTNSRGPVSITSVYAN